MCTLRQRRAVPFYRLFYLQKDKQKIEIQSKLCYSIPIVFCYEKMFMSNFAFLQAYWPDFANTLDFAENIFWKT